MAASGSELCTIDQLNDLKQFILNKIPSVTDPLDSYPVGSVYVSYTSTSPASRFGGTWTELKGVFPYFNHGTAPGGSNTHTLTVAQMPSHSHGFQASVMIQRQNGDYMNATTAVNPYWWLDRQNSTNTTGGGSSHNNMPSYQTFYAWRRTA